MITKRTAISIKITQMVILVIATFQLMSCEPDLSEDPIPFVPFPTYTVNVNLPEYQSLHSKGYIEINDIGVRGVILYKVKSDTYRAFERNCSFRPNEACATVSVHVSSLYMIDDCCKSTFDFEGNPTGGAAWIPMRQYVTSVSGSQVVISSDIAN